MKTHRKAYFLNTIVIVVLFAAMEVAAAVFGGESRFKLVWAPSLWL